METLNRRELISSLAAGAVLTVAGCRGRETPEAQARGQSEKLLTSPNGEVDWRAVRDLFPLSRDLVHLGAFLFVSHPKPVADAIEM